MAAQQALADPAVQAALKQQAKQLGGHAMVAAKFYGQQGMSAFQDYIQQGPRGVSTLCFVGGAATSALGVLNVCSVFGSIIDPFHYILNAYMFAFGLVTVCIEADTDRIGMLFSPFDRLAEPVTRAQAWLHYECQLLTRLRGRGLFYLYQGTLMVTQCVFCLLFLAGLYNVLMGFLCIAMSFGYTPDFDGLAATAGFEPLAGAEQGKAATAAAVEMSHVFPQAEAVWRQSKDRLPGKVGRELWALQRQASVGDCYEAKPEGVFNGNAKEQWRLWTALRGVPSEEAKVMFIERLRQNGIDF